MHRPVIEAVGWLKRFHEEGRRVVRLDEGVPIENVVPPEWRDLVPEKDRQGKSQVNCIDYEICVARGAARARAVQGDLDGGCGKTPKPR